MITELEGSDAPAGPMLKGLDNGEGARSEEPGLGRRIQGFSRLARETVENTIILILGKDRLPETPMLGEG